MKYVVLINSRCGIDPVLYYDYTGRVYDYTENIKNDVV